MKALRFLLPVILLALFLLPAEAWAQGCAMCKAVAASPSGSDVYGGTQAVGAGLNKGILFMMAIPYILLFIFFRKKIAGFVKEFRNAQG